MTILASAAKFSPPRHVILKFLALHVFHARGSIMSLAAPSHCRQLSDRLAELSTLSICQLWRILAPVDVRADLNTAQTHTPDRAHTITTTKE